MKRSRWFLLFMVLWMGPTDGMSQAMLPSPFYGGVSRLGVLCRVQDSSTEPEGMGIPDHATAEVVGLAMVALLSTTLLSSRIVVERLPENSDALADPKTLVIVLHGRIVAMHSLTGLGAGRWLLLSMAMYRHQASDGDRSLFPAAPVAIPLESWADEGGSDGGGSGHPARQALQKALTRMVTASGIHTVSPF